MVQSRHLALFQLTCRWLHANFDETPYLRMLSPASLVLGMVLASYVRTKTENPRSGGQHPRGVRHACGGYRSCGGFGRCGLRSGLAGSEQGAVGAVQCGNG